MLKVRPNEETGDAEVLYDDETLQGNYIGLILDDNQGMELLAQLVDFYEAKGARPLMMLNAAAKEHQPGFFRRLAFLFFGA